MKTEAQGAKVERFVGIVAEKRTRRTIDEWSPEGL
jgi:hypothetical protein